MGAPQGATPSMRGVFIPSEPGFRNAKQRQDPRCPLQIQTWNATPLSHTNSPPSPPLLPPQAPADQDESNARLSLLPGACLSSNVPQSPRALSISPAIGARLKARLPECPWEYCDPSSQPNSEAMSECSPP